MHHLFLATRNAHKAREFAVLLGLDFMVEDLSAHPEIAEVIEAGTTFAENARLKSIEVSRQLPGLVLADDSGLEVDSLGGAPGIYSARFAGAGACDAQNRKKLLEQLAKREASGQHVARFRCVLSLACSGEEVASFDGAIEGEIVRAERGDSGFGYDPLFRPKGFEQTFAELSAAEKNQISHRAVAAAKLRNFLADSAHPAA
ncbi:MAG: RdgB/HAM1 family non-canonical purine NTP pyrophosphatase [Chthoniobacterales bacterium]